MTQTIPFAKYQGAGNDFLILDSQKVHALLSATAYSLETFIRRVCDRHFGIGADGLFLINKITPTGGDVSFYNSDGSTAAMCGNGARCMTAYLFSRLSSDLQQLSLKLGDIYITGYRNTDGRYGIQMPAPEWIEWLPVQGGYLLDTGVPHLVLECTSLNELEALDLDTVARPLRYEIVCGETPGVNVDYYFPISPTEVVMRTYERGVEGETLACGTGAVAVALIASTVHNLASPLTIRVKGGELEVQWECEKIDHDEYLFRNVYLWGNATQIATGDYFL